MKLYLALLLLQSWPASAIDWSREERSAISQESCLKIYPHGKFLEVPLSAKEKYSLFYFSTEPILASRPTILHFSGGPGLVVTPAGHFDENENVKANVIYFHTRGSGCSQIPADKSYDSTISVSRVLEDVEAIRKDLKLESWDLVYGHSFGTVLGYHYASRYPTRLKKFLSEATVGPTSTQKEDKKQEFEIWLDSFNKNRVSQKLISEDDRLTISKVLDKEFRKSLDQMIELASTDLNTEIFKKIEREKKELLQSKMFLMQAVSELAYLGYTSTWKNNERVLMASSVALISEVLPYLVSEKLLKETKAILEEAHERVAKPYSAKGVSFPKMSERVREALSFTKETLYAPEKIPLKTPTLLIYGTHDMITTEQESLSFLKLAVSGSKYSLGIEGAGHYDSLPPGCLAKVISNFLAPTPDFKNLLTTEKECAPLGKFKLH